MIVTEAVSGPLTWSPSREAGNRDCSVGPWVGATLATVQPGAFTPVGPSVGFGGVCVAGGRAVALGAVAEKAAVAEGAIGDPAFARFVGAAAGPPAQAASIIASIAA